MGLISPSRADNERPSFSPPLLALSPSVSHVLHIAQVSSAVLLEAASKQSSTLKSKESQTQVWQTVWEQHGNEKRVLLTTTSRARRTVHGFLQYDGCSVYQRYCIPFFDGKRGIVWVYPPGAGVPPAPFFLLSLTPSVLCLSGAVDCSGLCRGFRLENQGQGIRFLRQGDQHRYHVKLEFQ